MHEIESNSEERMCSEWPVYVDLSIRPKTFFVVGWVHLGISFKDVALTVFRLLGAGEGQGETKWHQLEVN